MFKSNHQHTARSAGTSDKARIRVSQKLVDWAEIILVMEYKHRDILKQQFNLKVKPLIVLNIDDEYQYNDPDLIALLKAALSDYL
ncbi:protein tyrosine phosphatase [Mucilaginibacter litoreus]|uniref:Protein tyrosine phosphatase n=1 Tax=Mucilaginibacter litoreus TaxID=1048221 RepID=A0ABW3AWW8_9SPHI